MSTGKTEKQNSLQEGEEFSAFLEQFFQDVPEGARQEFLDACATVHTSEFPENS